MVDKDFRKAIDEYVNDGREDSQIILFENPAFDKSVVGITDDERLIYDYRKMVEEYMEDNECSEIDATEFIDYNTIRSLPYIGERAPVIMFYGLKNLMEEYGPSK